MENHVQSDLILQTKYKKTLPWWNFILCHKDKLHLMSHSYIAAQKIY